MSRISERQALDEIADLLPPGYIKLAPFSVKKDVTFEFNGVNVTLGKVRLNEALNCYMFDLAWGATNKIYGIPIKAGIDILKQYATPLPNLFVFNKKFAGKEIDSWRTMGFFVIDVSVLTNG